MVEKSGRKFPKRETLGFERGPVAAGTLGSNESLENTTIVNNPVIGDIVGWKRDFTDATGHAAIYAGTVIITNKGKKIAGGENSPGTIGAGTHTVNYRTLKYLENQKYLNPVYRRVGDN